jgi:hypothetical protein
MVRGVATTAVVAGTAGAVHHHQDKKWAKEDQEQYAPEEGYDEEQAPAAPAAPAADAGSDLTAQLQQLAELHESGVLSDEEFASAKAKLLGS